MTVSRDAVRWGYQLVLGREPESEQAIAGHLTAHDNRELHHRLISSAEYCSGAARAKRIGDYMNVETFDVETDCAADDLSAMLEGVAQSWRQYGETEPHWSVLTSEEYRPDAIDDNLEAFYKSGDYNLDRLRGFLLRNGAELDRLKGALDFGCGVGRVTLALATQFEHVKGVDISPAHIRHAQGRAVATGVSNVSFTPIASLADLDGVGRFDVVYSGIVLQHNPPPVIAALLRKLMAAVLPGGYLLFQVPTFKLGYNFSAAEYLAGNRVRMEMNAIPQRAIFAVGSEAGVIPLEVREDMDTSDVHTISQTFLFHRPL
jgi:2-polyprenyl-3-methyl-5-hydroxy-6-metoxy-1,4-benzoquinol methylase